MIDMPQHLHAIRINLLDFIDSDTENDSVESIKDKIGSFYNYYNMVVANLGSPAIFRVRKIKNGNHHLRQSELWHPPASNITRIGRANNIGVPILYCSLDSETAIRETSILPGDTFSLASYEIRPLDDNRMSSIVIREPSPILGQNNDFFEIGAELSKFMVREFTRPVSQGEEHLYKRSCAIAEILLELPYKDSIIYPSMRNPEAINIAIKSSSAKERVKLTQILTCEMQGDQSIQVLAIYLPVGDDGLQRQTPSPPLPCPLRVVGSPLNFSETFQTANIPSQ